MHLAKIGIISLATVILLAGVGCKNASPEAKNAKRLPEPTPTLAASSQDIKSGSVKVDFTYTLTPSWVAIHTAGNDEPTETVIGYAAIPATTSTDVMVNIDASKATPRLYAVLHDDKGAIGTFEPNIDTPTLFKENMVYYPFIAQDVKPDTTISKKLTRAISVTAENWEFKPSVITVKKGEQVKLTIKSIDVEHGFYLPQFNVNAKLTPNKETIVEFVADKAGSFNFSCNVFCGSGHKEMKGTLIVE